MGTSKQFTTDLDNSWLGLQINVEDKILEILAAKGHHIIRLFQEDFFADRGWLLPVTSTVKLGKMSGSSGHESGLVMFAGKKYCSGQSLGNKRKEDRATAEVGIS